MGEVVPIVSAILLIGFDASMSLPTGLEPSIASASLAAIQSWLIESLPDVAGEVQVRELQVSSGPPQIEITFDVFVLIGDPAEVASQISTEITQLNGEKASG